MSQTTVVIPNYKGRDCIGDCLESLFAGTVIPEVTVVDNASNDGSLSLIRQRYPKVRIVESPDRKRVV